jgi:hypothetical protein
MAGRVLLACPRHRHVPACSVMAGEVCLGETCPCGSGPQEADRSGDRAGITDSVIGEPNAARYRIANSSAVSCAAERTAVRVCRRGDDPVGLAFRQDRGTNMACGWGVFSDLSRIGRMHAAAGASSTDDGGVDPGGDGPAKDCGSSRSVSTSPLGVPVRFAAPSLALPCRRTP